MALMMNESIEFLPFVDHTDFAIYGADLQPIFLHAFDVVINDGDGKVGWQIYDLMHYPTFDQDEDLGGLGDFFDQVLLHLQHCVSQASKSIEAHMPGLDFVVQVTDGFVVVQNDDVSGVFVSWIHDEAETKVVEVFLVQLRFGLFHAHFVNRTELGPDSVEQIFASIFWWNASFAGSEEV